MAMDRVAVRVRGDRVGVPGGHRGGRRGDALTARERTSRHLVRRKKRETKISLRQLPFERGMRDMRAMVGSGPNHSCPVKLGRRQSDGRGALRHHTRIRSEKCERVRRIVVQWRGRLPRDVAGKKERSKAPRDRERKREG